MKNFYKKLLLSVLLIFPIAVIAQLNNGGINANFGVDGDTRNNYVKYGPSTGLILSDDWFSGVSSGYNVIDTVNASNYYNTLKSGANIAFSKRMAALLYSKINSKLWLDAVYGRDYICTNPLFDSTIFTIACKNGDDPNTWLGGISNVPSKNDLVDVYSHLRRDGTTVYDSLWLFTGVSTVGTSGSRYFDIELYKNNFSYDPNSGLFTSAGSDSGHTQWLFDASGNVTQTGDMILAVNYTPGAPPVVDVRIWVSSTTFSTVHPAYFSFGANFNGTYPAFGYASIVSKSGSTAFGSGIANYSSNAANDTTYSTPWGTEQSNQTWGTQYQTLQFVEIGLNLTRIGLDPALYKTIGLSPCQTLFSDIFFKSRSSNSFSSNMQDFVTPLAFMQPKMDFSVRPDTLKCNKTTGTIQLTNNSSVGYYTWQTVNGGNITGSNSDSSLISLNKPGSYIVSASPAPGCPATRVDTVVIPTDTFPPVASMTVGLTSDNAHLQFWGGNVTASNYQTPFGGSQGLLWNWSGPSGFSSTIQNPINDTVWGTYSLTVTEKRNGCTATVSKTLSPVLFYILQNSGFHLTGFYTNKAVVLRWSDLQPGDIQNFEIQRSKNGMDYTGIGNVEVNPESEDTLFSFNDFNPDDGNLFYRIKAVSKYGEVVYSNILEIRLDANAKQKYYLARNYQEPGVSLVSNVDRDYSATIVVYNLLGEVVQAQNVKFSAGTNVVKIRNSTGTQNNFFIVALLLNNHVAFTQKTIF